MRMAGWAAALAILAGLLTTAPAHAAGVNLRWDRCLGDGGVASRTFACDTNAGGEVLVCSFVLDEPVAQVHGNEIIIDVLSEADPIPPWWHFWEVGTCRQNSLLMNTLANGNDVVCVDWAAGSSVGGVVYTTEIGPTDPSLATRHRRIKAALAVAQENIADLVADTEYFSCNITINHAKTVGPTACAGCAGSVCFYLNSINVTTPLFANDRRIQGGTTPGSDMVHWQGFGVNCQLVPVKRSTWGQVKGLYR